MPNLAVNAGPGTGKTYTATRIPKYLRSSKKEIFLKNNQHTEEQIAIWEWVDNNILSPLQTDNSNYLPSILYAAYNADMVPEVEPLVPDIKQPFGVDVRTTHGAGAKVLKTKHGYLRINANRGIELVQKITGRNFYQMKDRYNWLATLRYIEKAKDELLPITPENCEVLRAKYDSLANMPIHSELVDQAKKLVPEMGKIDRALGIEYIDQIWLPLYILKHPVYDIGIIDECQDLSPARLLLVQKLCKHLIFVGDPDQAINAFAGADPRAFDKIRDVCQQELPLKISFRNPPNIVNKANALMLNRVIPDSKPRVLLKGLKTEKGIEKNITLNEIGAAIDPAHLGETMIICRYNAPLVKCILKLYKLKIPALILGKSIVKELSNIVKNRKATTLDELEYKLDNYEEMTIRSVPEHIKEVISDKITCIRLVMSLCEDIDDIETTLKQMFQPNPSQKHVTLSTIHKAKGKERNNIFILEPPIESKYASTPDQKQQEQNLHYVAITRTKQNLYWVYPQ